MRNTFRQRRLRERCAGVLGKTFAKLELVLFFRRLRKERTPFRAKRERVVERAAIVLQCGSERAPLELQPHAPVDRVEMRIAAFLPDEESETLLDAVKGFVNQKHTVLVIVLRKRKHDHRPELAAPFD